MLLLEDNSLFNIKAEIEKTLGFEISSILQDDILDTLFIKLEGVNSRIDSLNMERAVILERIKKRQKEIFSVSQI